MNEGLNKILNKYSAEIFNCLLKTLNFDYKYYNNFDQCPVFLVKGLFSKGIYLNPKDITHKNILSCFSNKDLEIVKNYGAILVNIPSDNLTMQDKNDMLLTIIHEKIHSKRNIIHGENDNYDINDAYQDILTKQYKFKIDLDNNEKIANQIIVDEALTELMSIFSYLLWKNEKMNINEDPFKVLGKIKNYLDENEEYDIIAIVEIILKHHNFDLFKWMIDPLYYQMGDIYFDYFDYYTKNDQELTSKLFGTKYNKIKK